MYTLVHYISHNTPNIVGCRRVGFHQLMIIRVLIAESAPLLSVESIHYIDSIPTRKGETDIIAPTDVD